MPLTDPTILNPPKRINPQVSFFYGREKIGKTTVMAQLPDSYLCVLKYEGAGADYISYRGHSFTSYKEFVDSLPQLQKWYKEGKFKRLVIDSVDALVSWIENVATERYGKTIAKEKDQVVATVFELGFGKGHKMALSIFQDIWAQLLTCCDELVWVGHCKVGESQTEQKVIPKEVDLPGNGLRNFVCYSCCAAGFMFLKDKSLWVTFHTEDEIAGGSRSKHLAAQRIELAKMVDGSLQADWSKIFLPSKQG